MIRYTYLTAFSGGVSGCVRAWQVRGVIIRQCDNTLDQLQDEGSHHLNTAAIGQPAGEGSHDSHV